MYLQQRGACSSPAEQRQRNACGGSGTASDAGHRPSSVSYRRHPAEWFGNQQKQPKRDAAQNRPICLDAGAGTVGIPSHACACQTHASPTLSPLPSCTAASEPSPLAPRLPLPRCRMDSQHLQHGRPASLNIRWLARPGTGFSSSPHHLRPCLSFLCCFCAICPLRSFVLLHPKCPVDTASLVPFLVQREVQSVPNRTDTLSTESGYSFVCTFDLQRFLLSFQFPASTASHPDSTPGEIATCPIHSQTVSISPHLAFLKEYDFDRYNLESK